VEAVGQIDLVKAVSEQGPWVMAFRKPAIEAVAGVSVDTLLVRRWVKAVVQFFGPTSEDRCRMFLTTEAANSFKELSSLAVEKKLEVFVCFHG
jgi:hypothetical protein